MSGDLDFCEHGLEEGGYYEGLDEETIDDLASTYCITHGSHWDLDSFVCDEAKSET